jgi:hypothetical protein
MIFYFYLIGFNLILYFYNEGYDFCYFIYKGYKNLSLCILYQESLDLLGFLIISC